MKKKIIIAISIIIVMIIAIVAVILFINRKPKIKPEDTWQKYISCINEQKYDEMNEMLTEK